jgi:hypothetical protein
MRRERHFDHHFQAWHIIFDFKRPIVEARHGGSERQAQS